MQILRSLDVFPNWEDCHNGHAISTHKSYTPYLYTAEINSFFFLAKPTCQTLLSLEKSLITSGLILKNWKTPLHAMLLSHYLFSEKIIN